MQLKLGLIPVNSDDSAINHAEKKEWFDSPAYIISQ